MIKQYQKLANDPLVELNIPAKTEPTMMLIWVNPTRQQARAKLSLMPHRKRQMPRE